MEVDRRTLLLLGIAGLVSGCGGNRPAAAPSSPPSSSRSPSPSASPSTAGPRLPSVTGWHPGPGELDPRCKATAVRHVEAAGNSASTALQVIDAQYGGLLTDSASVLVVTRSWGPAGGSLLAGGHTYDVRLVRAGPGWRVTAVHPSHPGAAGSISAAARLVLRSDRITLPPAARKDIESGQVHDTALLAMLTLAKTFRIELSVIRSGHPIYVFGTNRLSDHPRGRAFDTWRIDGHPVVDPRTPRSLVTDYMHAAAAAGSYNVGGPYLLGAAPQYFSDATHHDHVHAGFLT